MDFPIVCTLSDSELQNRRESVLKEVAAQVLETKALENGYAYRFPADALTRLTEVIGFERTCCQFLTFRLTLEPANGPIWLEISGPPGAKDFLATMFNHG